MAEDRIRNKAIELRRTRDFSQKFNATFDFLRQEFKPLFRGVIYIAGPAIVVASIFGAYYQKNSLSLLSFSFEDPEQFFNDDFLLSAIGMFLSSIVAYVMVLALIIEYARIYSEKGNNSVEVVELWPSVKMRLWGYFGSTIGYSILFLIIMFAGALVMALFIAGDLILLGVLGAFGFFFVILFASCWTYMAIIGFNLEETGFIENINRSMSLLRDNWWKTLGLVLIGYVMVSVASMVFAIPNSIVTFSTALHSVETQEAFDPSQSEEIIFALTAFVASAGGYLLYVVFALLVLFQYFNLAEIRDASGLLGRIKGIGSQNDDAAGEDF